MQSESPSGAVNDTPTQNEPQTYPMAQIAEYLTRDPITKEECIPIFSAVGLDIFSDLEKDFFFGIDVQSREEVCRRVHPSWHMGNFEVKLKHKITGVPQGGWDHFGLKKPCD